MRYIALLIFVLFSTFAFSQKNAKNANNAYKHYLDQNFNKAISIYKNMISDNNSHSVYIPYLLSLIAVEDYKEAQYLAKNFSKKFPKSLNYKLDIGIVQYKAGYLKKSTSTFNSIFKQLNGSRSQTINLANNFIRHKMYNEALTLYEKAEEINPNLACYIQKAQLFSLLGDQQSMIAQYLKELSVNPKSKYIVFSKIQGFISNDGIKNDNNYSLVRKELFPYVHRELERKEFSELLVWLYMQYEKYELAFKQVKALDKRLKLKGNEVYDLAEIFLDNKDYDLAIKAYNYIINKGQDNFLYIDAIVNKLFALTFNSDKSEYNNINNQYKNAISLLGKNSNSVTLLLNFAHFKAFYMHQLEQASNILEETMKIVNISDIDLAQCKMYYADIMLLLDQEWEALLYYSQVEKKYKENPIGHEAKLRRAKVAYYQGDFEWANAQLDILKSSTSKLISNDAMKLSLLITDNLNLDTSDVPLRMFAKAELLTYQREFSKAILQYDSILSNFNNHSLIDEVYLRKAKIYEELSNTNAAIKMYKNIISDYSYDILADDAIFFLAEIYKKNNKEKALSLYEIILSEYKESVYIFQARENFRNLRGDK